MPSLSWELRHADYIHIDTCRPPPEEAIGCCYGGVLRDACTCWEPIYSAEQPAQLAAPVPTRTALCEDCACRVDSPERREDRGEPGPYMASSWDGVQQLVDEGKPFYCHQGMVRVIGYRHPCGAEIFEASHNYQPARAPDGRPFRADGSPAEICAGWAKLRAAHLGRAEG